MATDAQLGYVRNLLAKTQIDEAVILEDYGVDTLEALSVEQASELIDELKALLH